MGKKETHERFHMLGGQEDKRYKRGGKHKNYTKILNSSDWLMGCASEKSKELIEAGLEKQGE